MKSIQSQFPIFVLVSSVMSDFGGIAVFIARGTDKFRSSNLIRYLPVRKAVLLVQKKFPDLAGSPRC